MRYENLIEDCWMQEEEEAHLEEEISCEQEEEEVTDTEMVDEEERCDPRPFGPHGETDTEDLPPLDSVEDAGPLLWTPLEMLSQGGCLPHAAGIPTRKSSCWISQSQANLGWQKMRLHREPLLVPDLTALGVRLNHESLPLQVEVLSLSPLSPRLGRV